MSINDRIERLAERVEGLVMTAELHQKELQTLGSHLQTIGSHLQTDAENIRALARIAGIHEHRPQKIIFPPRYN
jgi:archaellum component FlaC